MAHHDAHKLNLNQASRDELAQIVGVGDECADRIVEYREQHGGFKSIDELDSMKGFGGEAIRRLKEQATV